MNLSNLRCNRQADTLEVLILRAERRPFVIRIQTTENRRAGNDKQSFSSIFVPTSWDHSQHFLQNDYDVSIRSGHSLIKMSGV